MNYIKEYIKWFVIINTGVMLIVAINMAGYGAINGMTLWRILAASAATSLVTTIAFSIEPRGVMTKAKQFLYFVVFYLVLLVVMVSLGICFEWIDFSVTGILVMAASVAGVFICTIVLSAILGAVDAKKMNEALKDIHD